MRTTRSYAWPLLFALTRTLAGVVIGVATVFFCSLPVVLFEHYDISDDIPTVIGLGSGIGLLVGLAWGIGSLPIRSTGRGERT
jgi:hypothetical protein